MLFKFATSVEAALFQVIPVMLLSLNACVCACLRLFTELMLGVSLFPNYSYVNYSEIYYSSVEKKKKQVIINRSWDEHWSQSVMCVCVTQLVNESVYLLLFDCLFVYRH